MTKKTAEKSIARALQALHASEFKREIGYATCHGFATEVRTKARADGQPAPPIDVIWEQFKKRLQPC